MYQGHPDQLFGPTTYSHSGEDLMVANLFRILGIHKPSYLDIGAHHPFHISNTALFYQMGSRGVNVEANPHLMAEFQKHRPEDLNLCIGVGQITGELDFFMWDNHSGRNTFSHEWAKRLEVHTKTIKLPVITINSLVKTSCNNQYPDFLNLDTEGLDLEIVKSADFSQSKPKIICVEAWQQTAKEFIKTLNNKGFQYYCRCSLDLIFVQNELSHKLFV